MRIVKTGKSIMELTEEEANKLMKMVYGHTRNSNIPEAKKIELNDEDDCNIRVIYADDIEEREYIFEEEDIHRIDGCDYISSKIKMEFLINAGYLKIEE